MSVLKFLRLIVAALVAGAMGGLAFAAITSHSAPAPKQPPIYSVPCAPGTKVMCTSWRTTAATVSAPRGLMIQDDDLGNLETALPGAASDFTWVACKVTPCANGGSYINDYINESAFAAAVASGAQPPGSTALMDLEQPVFGTSKYESEHIEYYDKIGGLLARQYNITLIESPVDYVDGLPAGAEAAAPYAGIVEIQAQGHDATPAEFYDYADPIVKVIRAQSKTVPIMLGLATDAGGNILVSGATLYADYLKTYGLATYFWLNMHAWTGHAGCAPQGCPAAGATFVQDVTGG